MSRGSKKEKIKTIVTQQGDIIPLNEQNVQDSLGISFQGVVTGKQEKRPYEKSGRFRKERNGK